MGDEAEFTVRLNDEVSRSARDATKGIEGISKSFWILDIAAGNVIAKIVEKVADLTIEVAKFSTEAIKSFGQAAIEAASFGQQSQLAFEHLIGSGADAAKTFDDVRHMAADLGLDVKDTVHSFQELLAAQFSIGQAKELVKMAADMRVIGGDAQKVQSIFLALSQIKSVGVLQGGDLRQLEQAGISGKLVFDELSKSLGVSVQEVQKLQQAGKITADQGIDAIMKAVKFKLHENDLGDAGKEWANTTLEGFKGQLAGKFDNAMLDIGKLILPNLNHIAQSIQKVFSRLAESGLFQKLSDTLVRGFQRVADFVDMHMPEIESLVVGVVGAIISGVEGAIQVINFMNDHWEAVKVSLEVVAVGLGLVAFAFASVAAVVIGPFFFMAAAIGAVVEKVKELSAVGTEMFNQAMGWAKNLIDGLVQGIENFAGAALDKVKGFAQSIIDTFSFHMDMHSPSRVFADMGALTVDGFGEGIAANDTTVQGATADMASSAVQGVGQGNGAGGGAEGGGRSVTFGDIIVNVGGSSSSASDIAKEVRRELELAFEAA